MSDQAAGSEYLVPTQTLTLRLGADDRGSEWLIFAGTILLLLGTVNIVEGVAAIGNSQFYTPKAHYLFGDLTGWGWVVLANGVVQVAAGLGIFVRNESARWLGVCVAAINAVVQMLFIPAYPLWSLMLFTVDLLVIYALVVHGGLRFRSA